MKAMIMIAIILIPSLALGEKEAKASSNSFVQAAPSKSAYAQDMDKIDAIDREVIDLEAKEWAWRVSVVKDVTYEQLREYSKHWIMKEESKKQLFQKISDNIKNGRTSEPNPDETAKINDAHKRIHDILAPGSTDTKMIAGLTEEFCIALEGRYWALRVQNGEKNILTAMEKWRNNDYVVGIRKQIRSNLTKKNSPLTANEAYKMDGCGAKFNTR